jgi:hypothetical protein
MEIVLVIAALLLAIGVLAGTLLVLPAMWQGFRRQWERFSPGARRRGAVGGALTAVYMIVGAALFIAAPWGPNSVLYVMGVGGGAAMLLTLAAVVVQAVNETRRAQRPPRQQDSP